VVALSSRNGATATIDNLAECRLASTDAFSFKECVGLQHQASETLLASIENSWREYLASNTADNPASNAESGADGQELITEELEGATEHGASKISDITGTTTKSDASAGNPEKSTGSKVIAIVSDDTKSTEDTGTVINISSQALLESDYPALAINNLADLSLAAQRQRFEILADLYRRYRDERCTWDGGLHVVDSADVYITACKAWLNQERAKEISLQLSEKRVSDSRGNFFSGFYIEDGDGGIFQSCDRRQEWRLTGDSEILSAVASRYQAIARDNLEMAYMEIRGDFKERQRDAGFSGNLQVRSLNLLRAIVEADCAPVSLAKLSNPQTGTVSAGEGRDVSRLEKQDLPTSEPADTTVDALGASGFLYGYFANWVSACSVEQNSVCMAQVESGYTGLGEWRLVVDRSLQRQWRVQLIPTISDATISRDLNITVDGKIAGSYSVSSTGTTIKAEVGVVLAHGEPARQLVNQMRNGRALSVNWSLASEIGSELQFSLVGVTRALEFFDQNG